MHPISSSCGMASGPRVMRGPGASSVGACRGPQHVPSGEPVVASWGQFQEGLAGQLALAEEFQVLRQMAMAMMLGVRPEMQQELFWVVVPASLGSSYHVLRRGPSRDGFFRVREHVSLLRFGTKGWTKLAEDVRQPSASSAPRPAARPSGEPRDGRLQLLRSRQVCRQVSTCRTGFCVREPFAVPRQNRDGTESSLRLWSRLKWRQKRVRISS